MNVAHRSSVIPLRNWKNLLNNTKFMQIRLYAYYPEEYQKPLSNSKDLEELDNEDKLNELKFTSFRPAEISDSSSVFYDKKYEKFLNYVMMDGNKQTARKLMEKTFFEIKKIQLKKYLAAATEDEKMSIECDPLKIFHVAIQNCRPLLNVTPVKRGAVVYQVPIPLEPVKSEYLGCKWLLEAARDKGTKVHLPIKLSKELTDAFNYEGRVIKKKQDLHKLCENNRAYAHFRWG